MTTLRFNPPPSGPLANAGRFDIASNWTPQQAPGQGDTAIINTGTLYIRNQTLSGVSIFALSTSPFSGTGPYINLQSTVLGANSTMIVEGDLFTGTSVSTSLSFENDGRIELSFAGLGGQNKYNIVNKGTISLQNSMFGSATTIENDGVIILANSYPPDFYTTLTGTGTLRIAPASKVLFSQLPSQQTIVLTGGTTANTTISFGSLDQAPIAGFAVSDTIRFPNFYGAPTSLIYTATAAHTGTLTVRSASSSVSIILNGDYTSADFAAVTNPTYGGLSITTTRTDQGIESATPIYRFFNTADGTHFFTSSTSERDALVNTRSDLTFEGVGLNAADPATPATAAVYRFFDTRFGTHFYTSSAAERDGVVAARSDLTFEGTAFYEHTDARSGAVPVFRFFDTTYGTHFYTANAAEAASITQTRFDLTPEGIGFYAPG